MPSGKLKSRLDRLFSPKVLRELAIFGFACILSIILVTVFSVRSELPSWIGGAKRISEEAEQAFSQIKPGEIVSRFAVELDQCRNVSFWQVECAPKPAPFSGLDIGGSLALDPFGWCRPSIGLNTRCRCIDAATICDPPLEPGQSVSCCNAPAPSLPAAPRGDHYDFAIKTPVAAWRTFAAVWPDNAIAIGVFGAALLIGGLLSLAIVLSAAASQRNIVALAALPFILPFAVAGVEWLLLGALVLLNWLVGYVLSVLLWCWGVVKVPFDLYDWIKSLRGWLKLARSDPAGAAPP